MAGLKRIILIDTHLPGVVELKLDGHTNICGTNASGKTTLQRLIPVFYGEYPSRVVPATRDSFERWYLPRTSSFIIYEFTRAEGDLCQAVLSSNGTTWQQLPDAPKLLAVSDLRLCRAGCMCLKCVWAVCV